MSTTAPEGNGMWTGLRASLPLADLDPSRTDLRERFERHPLARHDAELASFVARLRGDGTLPRICLLSVGPGKGWKVARMGVARGAPPVWVTEQVFTDRDDAERWVFGLRWDLLTGACAPDDVPTGAVAGAPLPLTKRMLGYCEPQSASPGDRVGFHVSCTGDVGSYRASLVRMWCGDPKPEGPALRVEEVPSDVEGTYDAVHHPTVPGSHVLVPGVGDVLPVGEVTARILVRPTLRREEPQALVSVGDPWAGDGATGFALVLLPDGTPALVTPDGTAPVGDPVPLHAWTTVSATFTATPVPGAPLLVGAALRASGRTHHVAGMVEAPTLLVGDGVLAAWDLAPRAVDSWTVTDTGPHGLHGTIHNLARRGVRGAAWDGAATDWRDAPEQFAALHLYPDALEDCRWPVAFTLTVPDVPSGFYAVRLEARDGSGEVEWIPLFVRPPRGTRTSEIALLVPTATYAAYQCSRFWWEDPIQEMAQDRLVELCAEEQVLVTMPELSLSCYDRYLDGTAVMFSSRRRPNPFLRPGHGRAELYSSDLYLVDWLRHEGIDVDVITDDDLHHEGRTLIDGYRVLLTGTHPEYQSVAIWDAIAGWIDEGGRMMYLGGNGFFTNVGFSSERPWIMEDRGTLISLLDPEVKAFEAVQAVDGEPGLYFKELGRAPGTLLGVDFVTMGFDRAYPIVRTEASDDPALAWVFDGVPGRFIGGRGLLGGGAIGQEWDNARYTAEDPRVVVLGTTADTSLVPAVLGSERPYHGDVVLFARGAGVVFSTGSMSWCGALGVDGYGGDVAAVTRNVLRTFVSPDPVPLPFRGADR